MKHLTVLLLLFTSFAFAQNIEKCGQDDNPTLNKDEAIFLNNYFKETRGNFDFTGKKILIATGSAGTTPFGKQQYFGALRGADKEKINTKLYIFTIEEKKASGDYDAVISFWTKMEVNKKKVINKVRKGEWVIPTK